MKDLPLAARLRVWAAVQPPQGDFGRELYKAANEVDALERKLRDARGQARLFRSQLQLRDAEVRDV